jgi:hypothetical protein
MPKNNDATPAKSNKYGKKSSFSREKKFAANEDEIRLNEASINQYKEVRGQERKQNLEIANGLVGGALANGGTPIAGSSGPLATNTESR